MSRYADQRARRAEVRIRTLEAKLPVISTTPAWVAPSMLNGMGNWGLGFAIAGYHRDGLGYVHAKGLLKNASSVALPAGTPLLVFPAGYRPAEIHLCVTYGNAGTLQVLRVAPDGTVSAEVVVNASQAIWLGLNFLAEG